MKGHHQGFQVAGAEPDQGLVAAAAGHGHAETEQETADDGAGPAEGCGQIDGLIDVDGFGHMQCLGAKDGHGDGQHPGPEPVVIPHENGVRDGAHGAEVCPLRRRAENGT